MNLTASAIRNDRVTYLALALLLVGGVVALRSLPRAEDPGFTVRTALVTTYFPGAGPSRVEELVTDKIEEKVQEIAQLDYVNSESRTGVSLVFVNIQERYEEMRPIWDELRRKVEAVAQDLPQGTVGPFVDDDFGDVYPVMLTLSGEGFTYRQLKDVADEVRDRLLRLDSVAKVQIYGDQAERIFVEYNNARLAEVGLSPGQLRQILESRNILTPGGMVTAFGEDFVVEPSGNYESLEDIAATLIQLPGRGEVIELGDLARIQRAYAEPPEAIMHSTGTRCLGLSIAAPQDEGNVTFLGEQVKDLVDELRGVYPVGLDLDLVIFQPEFIDQKVRSFIVNLGEAIAIVLVVMLFSLGLRTGLVVSTLIPTTMLATLLLMRIGGVGLDQISIAALIIALGMLVDNAIVISESILVSLGEGMEPRRAAVTSADELRIPLLTSSLTTAAAFLPIYLAESSTGEYTASLFVVVTMALLTSWALSQTMMPLLCMRLLRPPRGEGEGYDTPFYRRYRAVLLAGLRRPVLSLLGAGGVFALALWAFGFVPNVFMPRSDSPRLLAELDLPLGTSIHVTESVVREIEDHLRQEYLAEEDGEGFTSWSTYIGNEGGPRYRLAYAPAYEGSEHASMILSATSRDFIEGVVPGIRAWVEERYPDLRQEWQPEAMGPAGESPVEVRLSGPAIDPLFERVGRVKEKLRSLPGAYNITDDWGMRVKKLRVRIDQARARRAGVTSQDVALSLQAAFSGIQTTEYREGDTIIPIQLRSVAADRTDLSKLEGLNVFAQATGRSVPLLQVAEVDVDYEPSKILRRNRDRTVTVGSQIAEGYGALDVSDEMSAWLREASRDWPRGYRWEIGGDLESSREANASIVQKLPVAAFVILLLLISQFNSYRKTAIILLTIPLGIIGVTIGLLLTGQNFSFMAFLGVISLSGIIINNAIVLIDRITLEIRDNGRDPADAIVESSQRRLRPILVTTATTMGGLLPLWFFGGPLWEPMAVSIVFGLAFATVLTLGLVPVLYRVLYRVDFPRD